MSIIKIHLYRQLNQRQQKYLLTYISDVHLTVKDFLLFAIDALKINSSVDDLIIQNNDGYMLPHCLKGKIIQKSQSTGILTIKVKSPKHSSPPFQFWTGQKIVQVNQNHNLKNVLNSMEVQRSQGNSSQQTPKFSEQGLSQLITQKNQYKAISKPVIQSHKKNKDSLKIKQKQNALKNHKQKIAQQKSKKHKKQQKKKKKMKQVSSSSEEQIQEQLEIPASQQQQQIQSSSSSSSESSQQQLPRVSRTKTHIKAEQQQNHKNHLKQKLKKKKSSQKEEEQIQQSHKKNHKTQNKQQKVLKNNKIQQQKQQQIKPKIIKNTFLSQQNPKTNQKKFLRQQSFGHQQKIQKKNYVVQNKINKKQQIQQKIIIQKQDIKNNKTNHSVTYAQRKKIIQDNDIQSSDSSSSQEEQILNKKKNQLNQKLSSIKNNQNQTTKKMLPPSLRNKIQNKSNVNNFNNNKINNAKQNTNNLQSSFKKHMEEQWLNITKQILAQFNVKKTPQQKNFLQPNNLIKFKQIQLDQQKFVPITSEWIQGTILTIDSQGKIVLGRVSQLGKDYRQRYEINEYNMVELQLNRNFLTQGQKSIVLKDSEKQNGSKPTSTTNNASPQKDQNIVVQSQQKVQSQQQQQLKNSQQKFICGQVNYYFSEKSYPYDLFMQMHANKHPQKYIPIRFLLNFPKIKKILKDENKLLQYLLTDEKKQIRNFEIDEQNKMIRRKIKSQKKQNQSQSNNKKQQNNIINENIIIIQQQNIQQNSKQ